MESERKRGGGEEDGEHLPLNIMITTEIWPPAPGHSAPRPPEQGRRSESMASTEQAWETTLGRGGVLLLGQGTACDLVDNNRHQGSQPAAKGEDGATQMICRAAAVINHRQPEGTARTHGRESGVAPRSTHRAVHVGGVIVTLQVEWDF
ncbi:hypothetical protein EYF80_022108 [Liparis tanakae]|uniref:Uncharacterized protein n=1 Tax=Liparis tanakae TaxID=230148 RepID=A0A4Z2HRM3_9TELE|nr:hypothetical protein EYF80_022108 [Liparis tanakae]